jgi:hypothetical protein
MNSYQISFIPRSWAVGVWRQSHKTTVALGPFRASISRNVPAWKQLTEAELIRQRLVDLATSKLRRRFVDALRVDVGCVVHRPDGTTAPSGTRVDAQPKAEAIKPKRCADCGCVDADVIWPLVDERRMQVVGHLCEECARAKRTAGGLIGARQLLHGKYPFDRCAACDHQRITHLSAVLHGRSGCASEGCNCQGFLREQVDKRPTSDNPIVNAYIEKIFCRCGHARAAHREKTEWGPAACTVEGCTCARYDSTPV